MFTLQSSYFMMNKRQEHNLNATLTNAHTDYAKGLSLHAFYKIRDRAVGQDLVQDAFMKTWIYLVRGGAHKTDARVSVSCTQ